MGAVKAFFDAPAAHTLENKITIRNSLSLVHSFGGDGDGDGGFIYTTIRRKSVQSLCSIRIIKTQKSHLAIQSDIIDGAITILELQENVREDEIRENRNTEEQIVSEAEANDVKLFCRD